MKVLLDTHVLLWAAGAVAPSDLPPAAEALISNTDNVMVFSAASIWEVAIKSGLGRADFRADANVLRRGLLDNGYVELPISAAHAAAVAHLPPIHKDPFDRMLIAQATIEGIVLVTADALVAQYPGPVQGL